MSTTYGTQSSITIPSDGDTIDAADVNVPLAASWDQHDFLDTLVALQAILVPTHGLVRYVRGYGHYTFVTSGTYSASTAIDPWILVATDGTAGRWVSEGAADALKTVVRSFAPHLMGALTTSFGAVAKTHDHSASGLRVPMTEQDNAGTDNTRYYDEGRGCRFYDAQAGSAIGKHLIFPINQYLVHGATFMSARLYLRGNGAHGATLPSMMPAIGVARYDPATDTTVSLKSGTAMYDDTSASAAAYDALHSFKIDLDQNQTIDLENYVYTFVVCNEGDANAKEELSLRHVKLTMTTAGYM